MTFLRAPEQPLTDGVVVLREQHESDADEVVLACQDPDIPRWTLVPGDYEHADWEQWCARRAEQREAGTGIHFTIRDNGHRLLGAIGLQEIDWDRRYGEIGYWLAKPARGKGYMARAVRVLTRWGHEQLGLETIEILPEPANEPSRRVALAAGYEERGTRPGPERCDCREVAVYVSSVP